MSDNKFQEAKDNLIPLDIYLRQTSLVLDNGYNPKYHPERLEIQHRREIISLIQAKITNETNGESSTQHIFSVTYALGVRLAQLASTSIQEDPADTEKAAEPLVMAELTAHFIAEYELKKDGLEQEALAMFAERNALYHIWPYWREYISSTVSRTRLPAIPLPTIQI